VGLEGWGDGVADLGRGEGKGGLGWMRVLAEVGAEIVVNGGTRWKQLGCVPGQIEAGWTPDSSLESGR
jgi:hypothetical protein